MSDASEPMGLLPVDKPVGPTSHDIVNRTRRALSTRRIGHTGTLDPFASGLLLLCVGRATRLAEYLDTFSKSYEATAVLGRSTTTDDRLGETVVESDRWQACGEESISSALATFRGTIRQVPPSYSAKKVGGEAMYHKARRGETVELPAVEVRVDAIERLDATLPEVRFRVTCSTGTYIRAIARDLGEILEVGAHLSDLRRTAIGPFHVREALPLEALGDPGRVRACWIEPLNAVAHLPAVEVADADVVALVQGRPLAGVERPLAGVGLPRAFDSAEVGDEAPSDGPVAIVHAGALVAVGFFRGDMLHPRKVFSHA